MKKTIALITLAAVAAFEMGADSKTDALLAENASLKTQLSKLMQPPIEVRRRKAVFGGDYVLQFLNYSAKPLALTVHLANEGRDAITNFDFTLPAATPGAKEIGHLEGWPVLAGDKILVKTEGYPDGHFNFSQ